jgi:hypothetical protein
MTYPLSLNGNTSIGREVMEFYANFVKGMPNEWGGYFFLSNTNRHSGNNDSVVGTIGFLLCHFGEWNKVSFEITSIRLYTPLRSPLRGLHDVYNLIEVIYS